MCVCVSARACVCVRVRACVTNLTGASDSSVLVVSTVVIAKSTERAVEQMTLPAITAHVVHHDGAAS